MWIFILIRFNIENFKKKTYSHLVHFGESILRTDLFRTLIERCSPIHAPQFAHIRAFLRSPTQGVVFIGNEFAAAKVDHFQHSLETALAIRHIHVQHVCRLQIQMDHHLNKTTVTKRKFHDFFAQRKAFKKKKKVFP